MQPTRASSRREIEPTGLADVGAERLISEVGTHLFEKLPLEDLERFAFGRSERIDKIAHSPRLGRPGQNAVHDDARAGNRFNTVFNQQNLQRPRRGQGRRRFGFEPPQRSALEARRRRSGAPDARGWWWA